MNGDGLTDQVAALLRSATGDAPPTARAALDDALRRLEEPLRIAIAGKVKAGKSTLLNALVGEELAPTDASECTRIVTWYRDAHTYRVLVHPRTGDPQQRPFARPRGAIEVDLGALAGDDVDHIEVWCPSARLRQHTLIDTPGIASLSVDVSARTHELLGADEQRPAAADAVVYLLRHLHSTDVRFLEAFHDADAGAATPVNAIGVLSRADEIGSCQLDAMDVAARVASRYEHDGKVRRLCSTVVPVAGLLAQAGATLREEEFHALATLASAPATAVAETLLTADRFAHAGSVVPLSDDTCRRLLARVGLFGVRLGERLVRSGVATSADVLAREFVARSGLTTLRSALLDRFGARGRVLIARSALHTLDAVLSEPGWRDAERYRHEVERVTAGAHELTEIRWLNLLYSGALKVADEQRDGLVRLLGGAGDDARTRLGLPPDASDDEVRSAAIDALRRWQALAQHPLADRATRVAARDAARSGEGILARLAAPATSDGLNS